nr:tetratricopeptide repeat protein [uncultured Rhodopila sp.]
MNDAALAEAMTLRQCGRLREAAALCHDILARDRDDADSLHLLGLIAAEQDSPHAGIALIRRAMVLKPGFAPHRNSLGFAWRRLGRLEDAAREYEAAAALRPESAEIHSNLATTLLDLGRLDEAVAEYRLAAELAPDNADVWYNLANALVATGSPAGTDQCYRTAIALKPGFADALANYGRWLMTRGSWAEAESRLAESLTLSPGQAGTWNNLGIVSHELGRAEAESCFRNAIEIDPRLADAHYNLGCLLSGHGRTDEAIACHRAALAAEPGFARARLAVCMAQLPILYGSEAEVVQRRQRYAAELDALAASDAASLADAIGTSQPFFLGYQQQDDRALQAVYGQLACRAMDEAFPPVMLAGPPAPGERIRLGIVSGFFCDHTLMKLFLEGWLTQLDRGRFEVTGFHTGRTADAITERCAGWCERFVQGLSSMSAWRDAILSAAPHILLYPEIGIDPTAGGLAAMRLAPVQCVAWGHPVTSGMPAIDHFLSSALMEPEDADARYTEKLVRLPNLGLFYTPDPPAGGGGAGRERFGLAADAPVFWSGQALYKYLPEYDSVFPRIAAELGACQFVFIAFAKSRAVTEAFRDRLSAAFSRAGLDAARHVVILPPLPQQDFVHAAGLADVILDTIGWSGGKSTLDCLAVDPAIVTLPGRFMRGRHTAAILRRIGCEATIAGSLAEYVSLAVRLARDSAWRAEVRQAVAVGKHLAFADAAYIRALETFLADAADDSIPQKVAGYAARGASPPWTPLRCKDNKTKD